MSEKTYVPIKYGLSFQPSDDQQFAKSDLIEKLIRTHRDILAEQEAYLDGREFCYLSDKPAPLLKRLSTSLRYRIYCLIKGWEFSDE